MTQQRLEVANGFWILGLTNLWASQEPLLYNRGLWIVFIDAVIRDDNKLPIAVRQILNVGAFIMAETFPS